VRQEGFTAENAEDAEKRWESNSRNVFD